MVVCSAIQTRRFRKVPKATLSITYYRPIRTGCPLTISHLTNTYCYTNISFRLRSVNTSFSYKFYETSRTRWNSTVSKQFR